VEEDGKADEVLKKLREGIIELDKVEKKKIGDEEKLGLFTFTGSSSAIYEFRATSIYCIPVYPDESEYFEEFSDWVSDVWFPKLSGMLNFIGGREGFRTGVISHAANLKPQPIPSPEIRENLGFKNGMLVTLLFGAVSKDMPIWLEATRDIMENHQHEEFWEISYYDANEFLRELAFYTGWPDWPQKKYMDI